MNPGQEMLYNFFIERAMDGKKEEAKSLLQGCFTKQDVGAFDRKYFEEIMPKLFAVVKPEAVEEVKSAMDNFSSSL